MNFLPRLVTTMTPLRITFAGGGTDIEEFYKQRNGSVVSTTIDKYIYVTVKKHSKIFEEEYRLSYSKTEHVDIIENIENDIARECLKLVKIDPPLFISTVADLPASSGLGSSSSFAVGLLYALHQMKGEDVSAGQLAEEACEIELVKLKRSIGKQDQYAAAYGGLNYISFRSDNSVLIESLSTNSNNVKDALNNSGLVWTGIKRDAGKILEKQISNMKNRSDCMDQIKSLSCLTRKKAKEGSLNAKSIGDILDKGWHLKRKLSDNVSNREIDDLYERMKVHGIYGGKISGAGGGGFLYIVGNKEIMRKIREKESDLEIINIKHEPRGARVICRIEM